VTINTVAIACLAGGVRRYLLQTGGGAGGGTLWQRLWWGQVKWQSVLRHPFGKQQQQQQPKEQKKQSTEQSAAAAAAATVPASLLLCSIVDTRAMRRGKGPSCNTLSFIGVPVATGPALPLARLAAVSKSLEWVRGSLAIFLAVTIPPIIQIFVREAAAASALLSVMLPGKTTLGFSNMRGPVKRVRLVGYPVEKMFNGVQPSTFGSFISLMSYDNQVGAKNGVVFDAALLDG
jgi:hypothetical protein